MSQFKTPKARPSVQSPFDVVLERAHKHNIHLTPREISEIIWLGNSWSAFDLSPPQTLLSLPKQFKADTEPPEPDNDLEPETTQDRQHDEPTIEDLPHKEPDEIISHPKNHGALKEGPWWVARVNLPQYQELAPSLNLARSLHRLSRTRETFGHPVLNIPLTVQRIAATGIYQLAFEQSRERSTHLIILIDNAGQLIPWQKTFEQIVALAKQVQSFAGIEVLDMDIRSDKSVKFHRRVIGGSEITLRQVTRTGMDHLVLVLSDGVGAAVSSGTLGEALRELPSESHIAWLHPWPPYNWSRTRLGHLRMVLPGIKPRGSKLASVIGVPTVPLSPDGLGTLEHWVQGFGQGNLLAYGIPIGIPPYQNEHIEYEKQTDWLERARRLAGILEPISLRLLALAAAIPGRTDIELLSSLGRAFGLQTSRYSLAEAMTAGFMERVEQENKHNVVLSFVSEDARRSLFPFLARSETQKVLDHIVERYSSERASDSEILYARETLRLPLDILTRVLRPEEGKKLEQQTSSAKVRASSAPMLRLLELMYPDFDSAISGTPDKQPNDIYEGSPFISPSKRKLIEVSLPLDTINKACAREKSIRQGHPSTLHLWWARRPLAAARAVIFSQMIDDPSAHPENFKTNAEQEEERQRLFRIIEDLVKWENISNEEVLQQARDEIWKNWRYTCAENSDGPQAKELFDPNKLPPFHDPFAGGGSLPLEAQRLALESYASDLNPVAVLINKAMLEIPPKFASKSPINPSKSESTTREWRGSQGLAEDVRYYGKWMREEAEKRVGNLYPKIEVTTSMAENRLDLKPLIGKPLTVIAWLWARTVKSPNPAFAHIDVPLASSFMLSAKVGKEAYVEPVIENGSYHFTVGVGTPKDVEAKKMGTSAGKRAAFKCIMSAAPISYDYIRSEGQAKRLRARLMAIVAESSSGRVYLSPTPEMEAIAQKTQPNDVPELELEAKTLGFRVQEYGMTKWSDLFTLRQLVALTTFSDLVQEARERVKQDALIAGFTDDGKSFHTGGTGATAYADAISLYLAFAVDKEAESLSTLCTWSTAPQNELVVSTFRRSALPMTWDFAEANPFAESSGSLARNIQVIARFIDYPLSAAVAGTAIQMNATTWIAKSANDLPRRPIVSTDPPYYDNIGYADLSDFFYIWLRRSLKPVFPEIFGTLATPKTEELVSNSYRHSSKERAEVFFLDSMTQAMRHLAEQSHPAFPVTIYYAFKQAETESDDETGSTSTGWDTFLETLIRAGFAISGTWPIRTERVARSVGINSFASGIVLVCRKRATNATTTTRREFVNTLRAELPVAITNLRRGNIAPVDLAQSIIGLGMAIYTRYEKVIDTEGKPLTVRSALTIINRIFDEVLTEQAGDFDSETLWALSWFEQFGFTEGEYGIADTLARAKNVAVSGLAEAGILKSSRGKVKLLKPNELPNNWNPTTDRRITIWKVAHLLIQALDATIEGSEQNAASLVVKLGSKTEAVRELCYRLYALCERKKRTAEALSYNTLVQSWPEIVRLAHEGNKK
jgi:putative DNA methylase